MNEIVPAVCAGIVSTFICNPLDILRLRYQLKSTNKFKPMSGIGMGLLTVPTFWGIYFPLYSNLYDIVPIPIAAYSACSIASIITAPLWYLRQKAQIGEPHSFKSTPIYKYYSGVLPTLFINLNFMIQIPMYEYLKSKLINKDTINIFLISSTSKVLSSVITYPLDTLRAMKRQSPNNTYLELLKSRNFYGFYRGLPVYLFRSVPYHTSLFCTYEYLTDSFHKKKNI
jgi:hypothetical protein